MNILNWIATHQVQITALLVAGIGIGLAKKIIPFISRAQKKERSPHARWASFVIYAISGIALAIAMVPFVMWLIGKLGSVGTFFVGTATLALGWHAVAMIVSVIRDLFDKVPDHEARTGALWIPTLVPVGISAVIALLKNPQGLGQGLTAAAMALVTVIYAYMIVKRMDNAQNHKKQWNWAAFGVLVLAGLVIIPLYAYADTALISMLPGNIQWLPRLVVGLLALSALIAAVCDIWFDGVPNKLARAGAIFGLPGVFVFGGIAWTAITGATQDGASFLNGVF